MIVYATAADLDDWTDGQAPDNADILLREASILVQAACRADLYDTLPSGLPADDVLAGAMRDACCAQVHAWAEANVDPIAGPGGQDPRLTVSAIDGASISYDTYLTADARAAMMTSLTGSAVRILRAAGLASGLVQS